MTTYSPAYYATVYAPRSEDSGEATGLVPVAGAIHREFLRVASFRRPGLPSVIVARKSSSDGADPPATARLQGLGYTVTQNLTATVTDCRAYDVVVVDCRAWAAHEHDAFIQDLVEDGQAVLVAGNDSGSGMFYCTAHATATPVGTAQPYAGVAHRVWENVGTMPSDGDSGVHMTALAAGAAALGSYVADANGISVVEYQDPATLGVLLHIPVFSLTGASMDQFLRNALDHLYQRGARLYLGPVRGRRGALDLLGKRTDVGELALDLLDARVTAGGSNLERWLTAFLGNTKGRSRLNGCKVRVWESLDAGDTVATFFTGRLYQPRLTSRQQFQLKVRDLTEDLKAPLFVGVPHSSITYAAPARLLPLGPPIAYGRWPITAKLNTSVVSKSGTVTKLAVTSTDRSNPANMVPDAFMAGSGATWNVAAPREQVASFLPEDGVQQKVRVTAKRLDTNAEGFLKLRSARVRYGDGRLYLSDLEVQDDTLAAPSTASIVVQVALEWVAPPTVAAPLVIADVHPATLFRDILDGKFGHLTAAGAVLQAVPYDTASYTALSGDTTFPNFRGIIEDREQVGLDWLEDHLFKPFGIGYRLNAAGQVVMLDLRRPVSSAGVLTIGNTDVAPAAGPPGWEVDGAGAVTRVDASYYVDHRLDLVEVREDAGRKAPAVPVTLLKPYRSEMVILHTDLTDLGVHETKVDAIGHRAQPGERVDQVAREVAVQQQLKAVAEDLAGPFGRGPITITLPLRRTANGDAWPGDLRLLDVDEVPDPSTNLRGGTRLVRCVGRMEDGPVIHGTFQDYGLNVTAGVPTIGTLALNAAEPNHAVDVPVTLNADGDPVLVEFAVTDTSTGTAPAETSSLWTFGYVKTATGTLTLYRAPAGRRVWVRARSVARAGDRLRLPSAWVFSTGTDYVDTTALATPSGLAAGSLTGKSALLTWTPGSSSLWTEVLVGLNGGSRAVVAQLEPGASRWTLTGLAASTAYTAEVRHIADFGSQGAGVTVNFTTGSTTPAAPQLAGIQVIIGVE